VSEPAPVALVLTPVASAAALAGLCSMTGIDVHVIPSRGGAVAVLELAGTAPAVPDDLSSLTEAGPAPSGPGGPGGARAGGAGPDDDGSSATADWDISELLPDDVAPEADDLARTLSRLSKTGVVLLTARLANEPGGADPGVTGQLSARRYTEGERGEDVPPGLVLAGADEVVEDLILGRVRVQDVRGHERSGTLPRWKAAQMFAKGLRRRRP
jgi:hypothetical protein